MVNQALAQAGAAIQTCLDDVLRDGPAGPISAGMAYATEGGKRLRGFLVIEGARLHGVPLTRSVWAAAAIEALHAYSLVHDDLPAMDDDDLRRGRPTVHIRWDEATAILVGDALQTLAFELLSRPDCAPDPAIRLDLIASLAAASGRAGMVLGQAQDIAAETAAQPLTLDQITTLQGHKTGALIRWSAEAGARLAGADPRALGTYAQALGLAFQIADDILDVEGDPRAAGKRLAKDAAAGKATFVGLLGLEGARARAADLVDRAASALDVYGDEAETLRQTARFVISRRS
ncbi:MAG: polyprenyl synthetase family protein [Qingshengfaniella sp.]